MFEKNAFVFVVVFCICWFRFCGMVDGSFICATCNIIWTTPSVAILAQAISPQPGTTLGSKLGSSHHWSELLVIILGNILIRPLHLNLHNRARLGLKSNVDERPRLLRTLVPSCWHFWFCCFRDCIFGPDFLLLLFRRYFWITHKWCHRKKGVRGQKTWETNLFKIVAQNPCE